MPCFCAALAGCGDSDNGDHGGGNPGSPLSEATIKSWEGTYELTGSTMNSSGCDAEGPSTLDSKMERFFVAVGWRVYGTNILQLASCAESADCAATAAAIRELTMYSPEFSLTMSSENGPNELAGFLAMSGYLDGNMCVERDYTDIVAMREGDTLRVESRRIPLRDKPTKDGICWAEAKQREEAQGQPCAELEVLTGTKVGPLP